MQAYNFSGVYTDPREGFNDCFLELGKLRGVKDLVKADQQNHRGN